jgi:hypothetical protein
MFTPKIQCALYIAGVCVKPGQSKLHKPNIINDLARIWVRRSLVDISVMSMTTGGCGFPQSIQLKPERVIPYNRAVEIPGDYIL